MADDQFRLTSVRLTRKYAESIDGVDLSQNQVGDVMDLPVGDARMLILEGWAAPCAPGSSADDRPEPGEGATERKR